MDHSLEDLDAEISPQKEEQFLSHCNSAVAHFFDSTLPFNFATHETEDPFSERAKGAEKASCRETVVQKGVLENPSSSLHLALLLKHLKTFRITL